MVYMQRAYLSGINVTLRKKVYKQYIAHNKVRSQCIVHSIIKSMYLRTRVNVKD